MAIPRRAARLLILTAVALLVFIVINIIPGSPDPSSSPKPPTQRAGKVHKGFDAKAPPEFYPRGSIKPLPTGSPRRLPRVQAPDSAFKQTAETKQRREAVRSAFKRSYGAYKKFAWMRDELSPVSGKAKDTFGGWAATLVDSLDTLWIMDLKTDFQQAAQAVASLDWSRTDSNAINIFETTIRHLGGLLSAYDLSGDKTLLTKATELGTMLYAGFDTPNNLPGFWLNFREASRGEMSAGTADPSASPASLCLEFTRLSQLTGDPKFYDATDRVTRFLERIQNKTMLPGMWPTVLDFQNEQARSSSFTLGALADSLYEYLPKMHALLGGVDDTYERMYRGAMDAAIDNLLFRPMLPDNNDILFTGDFHATKLRRLVPESQHLTCFVGGMFGLGGRLFEIDEHVEIAEKLARGCGWAYGSFPTGVMPEIFNLMPCENRTVCAWDEQEWKKNDDTKLPKGFVNTRDARYLLRPEAIESIFILYRITGKSDLQDLAWEMFQSIMTSTETKYANSAIRDVRVTGNTAKLDSMEVSCSVGTARCLFAMLTFRHRVFGLRRRSSTFISSFHHRT